MIGEHLDGRLPAHSNLKSENQSASGLYLVRRVEPLLKPILAVDRGTSEAAAAHSVTGS